jgi:hypothetical protein
MEGAQGCWQGRRLAVRLCVTDGLLLLVQTSLGEGGRTGLPKCVLERPEEIPDNSRFLKMRHSFLPSVFT